jgi:hypothetical protein
VITGLPVPGSDTVLVVLVVLVEVVVLAVAVAVVLVVLAVLAVGTTGGSCVAVWPTLEPHAAQASASTAQKTAANERTMVV